MNKIPSLSQSLFDAAQTDPDIKKQLAEQATRVVSIAEDPASQFTQPRDVTATEPSSSNPLAPKDVQGQEPFIASPLGQFIAEKSDFLIPALMDPVKAGAWETIAKGADKLVDKGAQYFDFLKNVDIYDDKSATIMDRAMIAAATMQASKEASSPEQLQYKLSRALKVMGAEKLDIPDEAKLGTPPVPILVKIKPDGTFDKVKIKSEEGEKEIPVATFPSKVFSKTEIEAIKRAENKYQKAYMLKKIAQQHGYTIHWAKGVDENGHTIPFDSDAEVENVVETVLYRPKSNDFKIVNKDNLKDIAGGLLVTWATVAGSLAGATAGGAAGLAATKNPWGAAEGAALGATAGAGVTAPVQASINDAIFGTHTAPQDIEEAAKMVWEKSKEDFLINQAFFVGIPAAVKGVVRAGKAVRGAYRTVKTAVGTDSYAPAAARAKAEKFIKLSGASKAEIDKSIKKLEKVANLPKDKALRETIGTLAVDNPTLNRNARELIAKDPNAAERMAKIAKSVEESLSSLTAKSGEVDIQAVKEGLKSYERMVKNLYQAGMNRIAELSKGKKFVVNQHVKTAALKIQEAITGIKDEAVVSKLKALNSRLLEWDSQAKKWVPRTLSAEEMIEVNKALNEILPTIKTYVGETSLRELQKGIKSMLSAASPEAGKVYQAINTRYARMMALKDSSIGKKILEKPYSTAKQSEFFRDMALTIEKDAPQAHMVFERLSPAQRAVAENQLLKSLVDTSKKSVEYMKHDYVDFASLSKKLEAIEKYKHKIFRTNLETYENLKTIVEAVKPFSNYMKMAHKTSTVGGKIASDINSWLSWGWVRFLRTMSNTMTQFIFKDTAYQRTLANALKETSPKSPTQVLKIIDRFIPKRRGISLTDEYMKVKSASEKIREGKPLTSFETYAMFGLPFGVDVKTDEKGKVTGVEFNAENAALGSLVGLFFAGKAPSSLVKKAKTMLRSGKSMKEVWRDLGVYLGRDGKWRIAISGEDYQLNVKKFKQAADKASEIWEKHQQTVAEFFDAAAGYGARSSAEALAMAEKYPELRQYVKRIHDLERKLEKTTVFKLEDIVTNKNARIFSKFPELRNYSVKVEPADPSTAGYHAGKTISLNPNTMVAYGDGKIKETLTHETQHAIQGLSGFSQGGGIENAIWASVRKKFPEARLYMSKITNAKTEKSLKKWLSKLNEYMSKKGYASPQDWFEKHTKEVQDAYLKMYGEAEARMAAMTAKMSDKDLQKMRSEGVLPDEIIKSKNRLKSWEDLTIVDQNNPFKFRDGISLNKLQRKSNMLVVPGNRAVHEIYVNPKKVSKIKGGDVLIDILPTGEAVKKGFFKHSARYVEDINRLAKKNGVKILGGQKSSDAEGVRLTIRGDESKVRRFLTDYEKKFGNKNIEVGKVKPEDLSKMKAKPADNVRVYDSEIKLHPATLGAMLGFEVEQTDSGQLVFRYNPVKGALGVLGGAIYKANGGVLDQRSFKALAGWLYRQGKLHIKDPHKIVMDAKIVKYAYHAKQQTQGVTE